MQRKLRTIGKFSQEFLDGLPALEQKMIENGLDPEDIIIVKTPHTPGVYGMGDSYTVTVKGQSFTVSMASFINLSGQLTSDMKFLEYFYSICFPLEEHAQTHPTEHKLNALLQRLEKWLVKDPLEK